MNNGIRHWSRCLACFLVFVLVAVSIPTMAASASTPDLVGKPLPAITLKDAEGNDIVLAPKDGRKLFIYYWADAGFSRMNLGRTALPALDIMTEEFRDQGIDIVVVSGNRNADDWIQYFDFKFDLLYDTGNQMQSYPPTIGVDSNGVVRTTGIGLSHMAWNSVEFLHKDIHRLLSWPREPQPNVLKPVMPAVGTEAPRIILPDYEHNFFDSESLKGESPVCYVFWNDGCSFAVSAVIRLRELHAEFNARGVEFVAITYDSVGLVNTHEWLSSHPLPFIHLTDLFGVAAKPYGVRGVPAMVVTDADGIITFAGSGDDIHIADLRAVLEAVAGPPIPGGFPGQPGSDPLRDLAPMVTVSGDFDGLVVYADPLLEADRVAALAIGVRAGLDELYQQLGVDATVFEGTDSALTFYADPMRYFNDTGAPCDAIGYCRTRFEDEVPWIRADVRWVADLETTLVVARHELVHALLKLRIGQVPPVWFDEGSADVLTRVHAADDFTVMSWHNRKPSPDKLESMWNTDDTWTPMAAREISHAAVSYIFLAHGEEGFEAILAALATGNNMEQAVQVGLGITMDRFWANFWDDVPNLQERAMGTPRTSRFEDFDTQQYGYYEASLLVDLLVIPGSGRFGPSQMLTRSQFAELTVKTLALPMDLVHKLNRPDDTITRYEAIAILSLGLGLSPNAAPVDWDYFGDHQKLPGWAEDHIWLAINLDLVDPMMNLQGIDSRLYISPKVRRLEAATLLSRAYHLRLAMLEHPSVLTLNIPGDEIDPQGAVLGPDGPGSGSENSEINPWIWVLAGILLVFLGAGAFFVLKRRTGKISA